MKKEQVGVLIIILALVVALVLIFTNGAKKDNPDSEATEAPIATDVLNTTENSDSILEGALKNAIIMMSNEESLKIVDYDNETESHEVLRTVENPNDITIYAIVSYTKTKDGSVVFEKQKVPTVIKFTKTAGMSELYLLDFRSIPNDDLKEASIKKYFPEDLWSKVL